MKLNVVRWGMISFWPVIVEYVDLCFYCIMCLDLEFYVIVFYLGFIRIIPEIQQFLALKQVFTFVYIFYSYYDNVEHIKIK